MIREMVDRRYWLFDDVVRRNGPLYKRMMHCATGRIVEMFRANADNWGYILALRTGPGDFNKVWAAKPWKGGSLPANVVLKDGFVWVNGRPVPTPTEEEFFDLIGLPCWPPGERSVMRLARFLLDRQKRQGRD